MFKFKVDSAQFASLELKTRSKINHLLGDPNLLDEVGAFVSQRVTYQARISKPLNKTGSLPTLKKKTVRERAYLEQYNKTDSTYATGRSNLTITGQLLNSYGHEVEGPGRLRLGFAGTHSPYRGKDGLLGDPVENAVIAEGLAFYGYIVIDKSVETNKTIVQRITSITKRFLRRALR